MTIQFNRIMLATFPIAHTSIILLLAHGLSSFLGLSVVSVDPTVSFDNLQNPV
jgi:hypothetical protein